MNSLISYAILGITGRTVTEEPGCIQGGGVRGSYTWDNKWDGMRFSLYVIGADSKDLVGMDACVGWTGRTGYSLTEPVPNESSPVTQPKPESGFSEFGAGAGRD